MKVLYTCFKGNNNSSFQVLSKLSGAKVCLTNSFDGLEKDIMKISNEYDMVVMLGLDSHIKDIVRIESVAEYGGAEEKSKLDYRTISRCFAERDIQCYVSEIPTRYLCNAAYYHMLRKVDGNAVFIHIPTTKNMSDTMMEKLGNVIQEIGK